MKVLTDEYPPWMFNREYLTARIHDGAKLHHCHEPQSMDDDCLTYCGRRMERKNALRINQATLDHLPYRNWCEKCMAVIERL